MPWNAVQGGAALGQLTSVPRKDLLLVNCALVIRTIRLTHVKVDVKILCKYK